MVYVFLFFFVFFERVFVAFLVFLKKSRGEASFSRCTYGTVFGQSHSLHELDPLLGPNKNLNLRKLQRISSMEPSTVKMDHRCFPTFSNREDK